MVHFKNHLKVLPLIILHNIILQLFKLFILLFFLKAFKILLAV